jgi:hypothetical protein
MTYTIESLLDTPVITRSRIRLAQRIAKGELNDISLGLDGVAFWVGRGHESIVSWENLDVIWPIWIPARKADGTHIGEMVETQCFCATCAMDDVNWGESGTLDVLIRETETAGYAAEGGLKCCHCDEFIVEPAEHWHLYATHGASMNDTDPGMYMSKEDANEALRDLAESFYGEDTVVVWDEPDMIYSRATVYRDEGHRTGPGAGYRIYMESCSERRCYEDDF